MAFDRGDYHYDDAGNWDRACRHIALFLWWAAERGLASEDHEDLKAIAKAPTKYFIGACDTKLWEDDFSAEGIAFANYAYTPYLGEVERYAKKLKISDYAIPENTKTKDHFFKFLDAQLAAFRSRTKKKAKKPAATKPKKKTKKRS